MFSYRAIVFFFILLSVAIAVEPRELLTKVERDLKRFPTSSSLLTMRAELGMSLMRYSDTERWILLAGNSPLLSAAWASKLGDADRLIESMNHVVLQYPADPQLYLDQAASYHYAGRDAESILKKAARDFPDDARIPAAHAEFDLFTGRYSSAVEKAAHAINLSPHWDKPYLILGDALYRENRTQQAIQAYEQALQKNPSLHSIRRLILHLQKDNRPFYADFVLDTELRSRRSTLPNPVSGVHRLIDQTILDIQSDGSYQAYVHQAICVTNQSGIAAASKMLAPGWILEARTILADGSIFTPEPTTDQWIYFPAVDVGAIVELRYVRSAPSMELFQYPRWYFQHPTQAESTGYSQFALLCPPDFHVQIVEHLQHKTIQKIDIVRNEKRLISWIFQDLPQIWHEQYSVAPEERLPWVHIAEKQSWRDFGMRMQAQLEDAVLFHITNDTLKYSQSEADEYIHDCIQYVNQIEEPVKFMSASDFPAYLRYARAVVLTALLRKNGFDANIVLMRPSNVFSSIPDWTIPDRRLFRAMLVQLKYNNKTIMIDPRYPFGIDELGDDCSGATLFYPLTGEFRTLELYPLRGIREHRSVILGPLSMTKRVIEQDGHWDGLEYTSEWHDAESVLKGNFYNGRVQTLIYHVTDNAIQHDDGWQSLSLRLRELPNISLDVDKKTELHIQFPLIIEENINYQLPSSESLYEPLPDISYQNRFGQVGRVSKRNGDSIEVRRWVHIPPCRILPDQYDIFISLFDKALESGRGRLYWKSSFQ